MVGDSPKDFQFLKEEIELFTNLDDVTCPICLDFPHNAVLLKCTSYSKGCRFFVCDTNHLHSNCLVRFIQANGIPFASQALSSTENLSLLSSGSQIRPVCPLCRGLVCEFVVSDWVRMLLDGKRRCCEEEKCKFSGTYLELQKHSQVEHPHACPSKVDPARQLDWENLQQSLETIDVLSTIRSAVPYGVVFGDYVIEYGDDSSVDELPRDHGNWWKCCVLCQVFNGFRRHRDRRRSRTSNQSLPNSGSVEIDDDLVNAMRLARRRAEQHSHRRHHSRLRSN